MKTHKKILLGLISVISIFAAVNFFIAPGKAQAVDENTLDGATYTLTGPGTIRLQLRNAGSEAGQAYNFIDDNPGDDTFNYVYYGPLSDGYMCAEIDLSGRPPTAQTTIQGTISGNVSTRSDTFDCLTDISAVVIILSDDSIPVVVTGEGGDETCNEGEPGCECDDEGNCTPTNVAADDVSGCTDAASIYFGWFICPVIAGIGEAVEGINLVVENLLEFNTEELLPDTGDVKTVWSSFRVLATSTLVIVMLVAIISHALGRGPFA